MKKKAYVNNIANEESLNTLLSATPINISVLGDSKTGKTNLIQCFLYESFDETGQDTILNIYRSKIKVKDFSLDLNIFDLSGNFDRDKELISDYVKVAHIIIICHSFEHEFNEENIKNWLEFIEQKAYNMRNIYLVGCKYDLKAIVDYQRGERNTSIRTPTNKLTHFGERIKTFINNAAHNIREYFITSSLMNFNIKEMMETIIKDFIYENLIARNYKTQSKDNSNCCVF